MPQVRVQGTTTTTAKTAEPVKLHKALKDPQLEKVAAGGAPLARGARGAGVQKVQEALSRAGVATFTDGDFGPGTEKSLKTYQRKTKLQQTGKIDAPTLARLSLSLKKLDEKNQVEPGADKALDNARFADNKQLAGVLSGKEVLATGSKGDGLKAVQQALDDMGFGPHGGADGAYGPMTAKNLRNFQTHAATRFADVKVNGKLDAATLRALDALAPAPGKKGQNGNLPRPIYNGKQVRIVVVKSEHRTYLFDKNGKIEGIYPNAVGASATQTDSGLKVIRGILNERDAANTGKTLWGDPTVFGPRIINLEWADGRRSGEELRGTNAPPRLGEDVSHGCMRHDNKDIVHISSRVKDGEYVAVVGSLNELQRR